MTTLEILLDLLAGKIPENEEDRTIELPFEMFREEDSTIEPQRKIEIAWSEK